MKRLLSIFLVLALLLPVLAFAEGEPEGEDEEFEIVEIAEDEYEVFSGRSRLTILGYDPSVRSTADVPNPITRRSMPAFGSISFITRYGL